jgi:hypothetical protein
MYYRMLSGGGARQTLKIVPKVRTFLYEFYLVVGGGEKNQKFSDQNQSGIFSNLIRQL